MKRVLAPLSLVFALLACSGEESSTIKSDQDPIPYQISPNSELFSENVGAPADVQARVLSQMKAAFALYKAGFREVLGIDTDIIVRKIQIIEGPTETIEGNISVEAGAGSSRSGSTAVASGSVSGTAKAVNVSYSVQFEFLLQDHNSSSHGVILRYPEQPLTIEAQKEITVSANAAGQVSGLAALPGPLKRIVSFLLVDINAKLAGGFTYTKNGAVSAVDLDYKAKDGQQLTPFIGNVASSVIHPLCVEARTSLGLSPAVCDVTIDKIADPVTEAEKLLARTEANPVFRQCLSSDEREQFNTLPIYYLYFSKLSNSIAKDSKVYLYKLNSTGQMAKYQGQAKFSGKVADSFCPGKSQDESCHAIRIGTRDGSFDEKCSAGFAGETLTYSTENRNTL